ncbi:MAG: hypothetical protein ABIZ56_02880, partial [Chthoniobacteraceae bacterium]
WIILGVVGALCAVVFAVLIYAGFTTFQRVKEKAEASREARSQIEKATAEERQKMADMIESGDTTGGDASLGRVKDQLEKSAAAMKGADAVTMRALAAVTGKMQSDLKEYEAALGRVTEAEVFAFRIRDKATLAAHRQLIGEFLASNRQLTETLKNGGELVRSELDKAGVSQKIRDATVAGFVSSQQKMRPLQMRIRGADQVLGDSALSILDLLEKNWGKWKTDNASGAPIFNDDSTLEAYNAHIEKIQAAAADQSEAQGELVRLMRAK